MLRTINILTLFTLLGLSSVANALQGKSHMGATVEQGVPHSFVYTVTNTEGGQPTYVFDGFRGDPAGEFIVDEAKTTCKGQVIGIGKGCDIVIIFKSDVLGLKNSTTVTIRSGVNQYHLRNEVLTTTVIPKKPDSQITAEPLKNLPEKTIMKTEYKNVLASFVNNGNVDVQIEDIDYSGPERFDFDQITSSANETRCEKNGVLKARSSCIVTATFNPQHPTPEDGAAVIVRLRYKDADEIRNAVKEVQSMARTTVKEQPTEVRFIAGKYDIPQMYVGKPATVTFNFTKVGEAPVEEVQSTVRIELAKSKSSTLETLSQTCSGTVTEKQCSVKGTFTPGAVGELNFVAELKYKGMDKPITVSAKGNVRQDAGVEIKADSIAREQQAGTAVTEASFYITNYSDKEATITMKPELIVHRQVINESKFHVAKATTCGATLAKDEKCRYVIEGAMIPQSAVNANVTVRVTVNDGPKAEQSSYAVARRLPETLVGVGMKGNILFAHNKGEVWHPAQILTTNANTAEVNFNDVIWSGNRYIAVGDKGAIFISYDGEKWRAIEKPLPNSEHYALNAITMFQGGYFIVGEDKTPGKEQALIITGQQGKEWKVEKLAENVSLQSVATSGTDIIIAGNRREGNAGILYYLFEQKNPPLREWRLLEDERFKKFNDLAWTGNQFAVAGVEGTVFTVNGEKSEFSNVRSWREQRLCDADDKNMVGIVARDAATLVAISEDGNVFTSTEIGCWNTETIKHDNDQISNIAWTGDYLIASGKGEVYKKQGNAQWKPFERVQTDEQLSALTASVFPVVAQITNLPLETYQLEKPYDISVTFFNTGELNAIALQKSKFMVKMNGNYIEGDLEQGSSNCSTNLAAGSSCRMLASFAPKDKKLDKQTLEISASLKSENGVDVAARTQTKVKLTNDHMLAVGGHELDKKAVIYYHKDDEAGDEKWWPVSTNNLPSTLPRQLNEIIWVPRHPVPLTLAVGHDGYVMRSTNHGKEWQELICVFGKDECNEAQPNLHGIAYSQAHGFVVVGGQGNKGSIYVSSDGENWTEATNYNKSIQYDFVTWAPKANNGQGLFVALASTYVCSSLDAHNWKCSDSYADRVWGGNSLAGIVWAKDRFIMVGYLGEIFTSKTGDVGEPWKAHPALHRTELGKLPAWLHERVTGIAWDPVGENIVIVGHDWWGGSRAPGFASGFIIHGKLASDGEFNWKKAKELTWYAQKPKPDYTALYDIEWVNGEFVAVGRDGNIWTSTDGEPDNWRRREVFNPVPGNPVRAQFQGVSK